MTFEEFKRKIEGCKSSLEYADENDIDSKLRTLSDLIETGKNESHIDNFKYSRIKNEITDMGKYEYRVKKGMSKSDIENRLRLMRASFNSALDSIIYSSEKE